ncbi:MAG: hypothetical protein ACKV2Q_07665, partial [Planctomycetaceae bacterium]
MVAFVVSLHSLDSFESENGELGPGDARNPAPHLKRLAKRCGAKRFWQCVFHPRLGFAPPRR